MSEHVPPSGVPRRRILHGMAAMAAVSQVPVWRSAHAAALVSAASDDSYDGSAMWLHYVPVSDPHLLGQYRAQVAAIVVDNAGQNPVYRHTPDLHMYPGSTEHLVDTTLEAARDELVRGLRVAGPGRPG